MKNKQMLYIIITTFCFFIPSFLHAQLKITEIMYDPEGSDSKREWIEVLNSGSDTIDLSKYYLLENNVYHKIVSEGSALLDSGQYAVIASSITDLAQEYSGYTGLLVDSVFSLNNTGETITMADPSKVTIDTFTYSIEMGANNNGHSIQINDGAIVTALPTFGTVNKTESETIESEDTSDSGTSGSSSGSSSSSGSGHSGQNGISTFTPAADFKVSAGRSRRVSINTPIEFESLISKSEIRTKSKWNFGDFETDTGRRVEHIYKYPGTYQLVLETKSKDYTAIARTEVKVVEPQLTIDNQLHKIVFTNNDSREINIGKFKLIFKEDEFVVPQDTIIVAKSSITFSNSNMYTLRRFEYPNSNVYLDFELFPTSLGELSTQSSLILIQ